MQIEYANYADHVELGMDHFSKVRVIIWDARSSYQNLAYGLGLSPASVNTIKQSNHYDMEKCFDGILEEVLKNGLSRNKLAEVLESRQLDYGLLANKVRVAKFGMLLCIAIVRTWSLCLLTLVLKVLLELFEQLVSVMG